MDDKLHGYTAKEWMLAFLDVVDGNSSPHDLRSHTGLPIDECERLSKMFNDATKEGWPK